MSTLRIFAQGIAALALLVTVCGATFSPYVRFAPDGIGSQMFFSQVSEEFACSGAGSAPNRSLWNYDVGYIANNEKEWYTARPENNFLSTDEDGLNVCGTASTNDGFLQIVALKDADYRGSNFNYTSSRLTSRGLFCVEMGSLVEVRARVPSGRGTWPALWLLGPDTATIGWPKTGEIDFMEAVGYIPNRTFTTIHGDALTPGGATHIGGNESAPTLYNEFHVYAVLWNSSGIFFFTDNVSTFSIPKTEILTWAPFAEDRCFELIINLAIGGDWGGHDGIDDSIFPVNFTVDYVHVYSSNESAAYVNNSGFNEPGQIFGLGSCSAAPQNWTLASLDRLRFPQFTPYVTTTAIPKLDACVGTNIFVGGVGGGYLYDIPGGSADYDVVRDPTTGILRTSNGNKLFASAELAVYSTGTTASSTSCCVYYATPVSPATPAPSTTTAAPTSVPAGNPVDEGMGSGTKAVIGVGVVLGVIGIGLGITYVRRGARKSQYEHVDPNAELEAGNAEYPV